MADRQEALLRATSHVAPSWSPEREQRVRAKFDVKRVASARRRRASVVAFAAVLAGVLSVVGARYLMPGWDKPFVMRSPPAPTPLVRFEDGTVATGLSADSRLTPVEVRPEAVGVRLESGAARFSVAPNPERTFRVMARDVTVTVLGTVFSVALDKADVRVTVERGRVHVAWPSGERDLTVGQDVVVKAEAVPASTRPVGAEAPKPVDAVDAVEGARTESVPEAAPVVNAPEHSVRAAPQPAGQSWRALAQEGDYSRAFTVLSAEGAAAVRDDPEDLLLSADVARLGGQPRRALAPLERILSAHASDSRAPLAAFTLGRTLLEQLGRPREAAQAFATAQRLDPKGALSQDALAREVESWSRAGDAALARERAERYSERYPKGRRLQAVRRLGGLD
jgi:transmembrane sensor